MTTKAGERLLEADLRDRSAEIIAEKQAEAVRDALTDLRAAVVGMFGQLHPMCAVEDEPTDKRVVSRKAVLAAIDKRTPGGAG